MLDNQWSGVNKAELGINSLKIFALMLKGKNRNILEIEDFFNDIYKKKITLTTSARSAIRMILENNKIDRRDTAFITKFSSYCLYQAVGSLTNVSTDYSDPKVVLVNHKWGKLNSYLSQSSKKILVIEDSCDSLVKFKEDLFPNGGDYEIFSLSKIIQSVSGGLIVHNDDGSAIRENTNNSSTRSFSFFQFIRKLARVMFPKYRWKEIAYDHLNHRLNFIEVSVIRFCLKNYSSNLATAEKRFSEIENICGPKFMKNSNRFGPGIVIELTSDVIKPLEFRIPTNIIIRHFDTSRKNDYQSNYKEVLYAPVHSSISDKSFERIKDFIIDIYTKIEKVY